MAKFCPSCGASAPDDAVFCANCGTPFKKGVQEPSPRPPPAAQYGPSTTAYIPSTEVFQTYLSNEEHVLAGLGSRCGAWFVDALICSLPLAICCPLGCIYSGLKDAMSDGRSIGKSMFNIRVIDQFTGEPCNVNQSCIRNGFCGATTCPFTLFFDRYRRHTGDWFARTIVVEDREVKR
ncbi:MAG: zinc-ribbon domain-containing protein [Promethearchaeota archaeon]